MRQYVAVKFRETDLRSYTYANDGEPVAAGNRVLVTTAKGQQKVTVIGVGYDEPPFACKPIDGLAPIAETGADPRSEGDPLDDYHETF